MSGTLGNDEGDQAGTEGSILFPGESGSEKRPGTSGNGFLGFPVASLDVSAEIKCEVTFITFVVF